MKTRVTVPSGYTTLHGRLEGFDVWTGDLPVLAEGIELHILEGWGTFRVHAVWIDLVEGEQVIEIKDSAGELRRHFTSI